MNAKTINNDGTADARTEADPKKVVGIMVTLNKGGTGEKTVRLSEVEIPDLWHIAQSKMDPDCRRAILDCWHITHDLKRTVEEQAVAAAGGDK